MDSSNYPLPECTCSDHIVSSSCECLTPTDIEESRLHQIKQDLLNSIKNIECAKNQLCLSSKSLIKTIEALLKQSLKKLDDISQSYLKLLHQKTLYQSDLNTIANLEKINTTHNFTNIEEIQSRIENFYNQIMENLKEVPKIREFEFLSQHCGGFWCGVITDDTKTLITGGCDSVIRVWDLNLKQQKFIMLGHHSDVYSLALTGDNNHIVSGSSDSSVRIWSLTQMSQVAILTGHKDQINSVCFVKKNSNIVSGDLSGQVIIWHFTKHTILRRINVPCIWRLHLNNDESYIIAGSKHDIVFLNLETGTKAKTFVGHEGSVWSIVFTRDERVMVSGAGDKVIIKWYVEKSKIISRLEGHTGIIGALALSLDEKFLVSGANDCTVRMWNLYTCRQLILIDSHENIVNCILRVKNDFLSFSSDSSIGELCFETKEFKKNFPLRCFNCDNVNYSPDNKFIGYGSKNEACIWDLEKENNKNIFLGHNESVSWVEISRDGRKALSCSGGYINNLILWDIETNQKVNELIGHDSYVLCASFSKDGLKAASGSNDMKVIVWNLSNYVMEFEFEEYEIPQSIKFLDKKGLLVIGSSEGNIHICSLEDSDFLSVLKSQNQVIWKVIATEDENFIISCDLYHGIKIFNVNSRHSEFIFLYEKEAENWLKLNRIPFHLVKRYLKPSQPYS